MRKILVALIKNKMASKFCFTFFDNWKIFHKNTHAYRGPLGIVWDITPLCNAKCKFCGYWKMKEEDTILKKELSLKEKIGIIRELSQTGVCFLSFCSGEPLISQDLEFLLQEAKRNSMVVNVSTNGSLLAEKAKILIRYVDFITVSVDSYSSYTHDRLRGRKGLFEGLKEGIEKIRRLRKGFSPYIEIRCLISRENAFELEKIIDYWKNKVDSIFFKPIYANSNVLFKVPPKMQLQAEDEERFKIYYFNFLKKYKNLNTLYHREIFNFFFNKNSLKKYKCFAGTFFGHIDFEGNLYPCKEMNLDIEKIYLGNLRENSFLELWNSRKIREIRRALKEGFRCDCWVDKFIFNIRLQKILPFC